MAMIFVHDYKKGRRKSYTVWAIPCSANLTKEQILRRIRKALVECYSGLIFTDRQDRRLPSGKVADAVIALALEQKRTFWEYQTRFGYVVAVPVEHSMERISDGLQDIETAALRLKGWRRG
jgi:hypothetical protein